MIRSVTRFFGGIADRVTDLFDRSGKGTASSSPSAASGWKGFAEKLLGPEKPTPGVWSVGVHRTGQRVQALNIAPGMATPPPAHTAGVQETTTNPEESAPPRPPGAGATLNDLLRELDVRESKPEPFTNPLFRYDEIPEAPAREPLEPARSRPPTPPPAAVQRYELQPPSPRGSRVDLTG